MQEAEEAAAEAEAEGGGRFHFERERRVVEAQLAHCRAQVLEVGGIDREEAAEHHRLCRLEARQRLGGRALVFGDGVADAGIGHFLDRGGDEADLAGAKRIHRDHLRRQHADAFDRVLGVGAHHPDGHALLERAVDDAHENHDAEIGVVPAVDQQRLQGRRIAAVALRRRQLVDDRFEHVRNAEAGLRRNQHRVRSVDADHFLDLLLDAVRFGRRQVDLVEHGDELVVVVDRLVDVGERLGFNSLGGVDDQQRTFAGRQRA
ncbi:hypothetical protein D9M72_464320 [compost metagenome]